MLGMSNRSGKRTIFQLELYENMLIEEAPCTFNMHLTISGILKLEIPLASPNNNMFAN